VFNLLKIWRSFCFRAITLLTILIIIIVHPQPSISQDIQQFSSQVHPLPAKLANWQDTQNSGDYFQEIDTPEFGQLIWSEFPIQVYIEQPNTANSSKWREIVREAIFQWQPYLDFTLVDQAETADIVIYRRQPPISLTRMRSRSAEARYQLYLQNKNGKSVLKQKFTIWLSPNQVGAYIASAARHEFGHALGIWGHSPQPEDVMYYSQVQSPPNISPRDINTLKKIYQQTTRLGGVLMTE
jgi:predicted Zn-dependent protease